MFTPNFLWSLLLSPSVILAAPVRLDVRHPATVKDVALAIIAEMLPLPSPQHPGIPSGTADATGYNWIGWLAGWAGGSEGVLKVLTKPSPHEPLTNASVLITFPTRLSSFTPHTPESPDSIDGSLIPFTSFPASPNSSYTLYIDNLNLYGCPPMPSKEVSLPRLHDDSQASHLPAGAGSSRIGLVLRGKCSFTEKVLYAQKLGASGVVVGDDVISEDETEEEGLSRESLLTMYSPLEPEALGITIPSVFISRRSYLLITRLFTASGISSSATHPSLSISLTLPPPQTTYPLPTLLVMLLLLPSILTLATLIVHHIRAAQLQRKERATDDVVNGLETRIWSPTGWEKDEDGCEIVPSEEEITRAATGADQPAHTAHTHLSSDNEPAAEGSSSSTPIPPPTSPPPHIHHPSYTKTNRPHQYFGHDECAICLESFVPGDIVRILPCGHVFHLHVDEWLLKWKKLCPCCKQDITALPSSSNKKPSSPPTLPAPASETTAPVQPTERTPLLQSTTSSTLCNDHTTNSSSAA